MRIISGFTQAKLHICYQITCYRGDKFYEMRVKLLEESENICTFDPQYELEIYNQVGDSIYCSHYCPYTDWTFPDGLGRDDTAGRRVELRILRDREA